MDLKLRPKEECKFDEISLGEIMLRLDPGEGRIKTSRTFRAWEGGGEYNVARALRKVFSQRTAIVTALADNEVGKLKRVDAEVADKLGFRLDFFCRYAELIYEQRFDFFKHNMSPFQNKALVSLKISFDII